MNKLLAILCLLLTCSIPSFAAFGSATAWDVRTTGSDSNGGCFDSGVASPGTDGSIAAAVAYTDIVIDGTTNTKITSAAHPFSSTSPGNCVNITSGTGFTVQRIEIISVSGAVATCDKAVGTVGSTGGAGTYGGSLLTPDTANTLEVAGNTIWLKTGTYSRSTTLSLTSVATSYLKGYGTTHGDLGTAPLITTATNSTPLVFFNASTFEEIQNISFSNTASTRSNGIECRAGFRLLLDRTTWDGFTKGITGDNSGSTNICTLVQLTNSEIKNTTVFAISNGAMYLADNYIHDNASSGSYGGVVSQSSTGALVAIRNIIVKNTSTGNNPNFGYGLLVGAGSNPTYIIGNTIADNYNSQIFMGGGNWYGVIEDNILYGSTIGWGIDLSNSLDVPYVAILNNNGFGANTAGNTQTPLTTGTNPPVTLTADPFTNDSGSNRDYSLNATAGGGAALKAAGFPGVFPGGTTTGYASIGAAEPQCSAGGTGVTPQMCMQ